MPARGRRQVAGAGSVRTPSDAGAGPNRAGRLRERVSEPALSADDEGKEVRAPSGDLLGHVETVEEGIAYVDPAEGRSLSELGWARDEGEPFPLEAQHVAETTDEAVRIAER